MKRSATSTTGDCNRKAKDAKKKINTSSELDALLGPVMNIFMENNDMLHWTDLITFGSLNRECHKMYLEKRDAILQPLLKQLEGMVGSNKHRDCWKVYAPASQLVCTCTSNNDYYNPPEDHEFAQLDPRYEESYDALTIHDKCAKMVHFLTTIVSNMHGQFHFDDLDNPDNLPNALGTVNGWIGISLDGSRNLGGEHIQLYPRRASLALNIALMALASRDMENCPQDGYFYPAFAGIGDIEPSGSGFYAGVGEMATFAMLPLCKESFVTFLKKEVYPKSEVLDLLGPALVSKVVLCAPLFAFVPPSSTEHAGTGDDDVQLPTGLEPFQEEDLMDVFGTSDLGRIRRGEYQHVRFD